MRVRVGDVQLYFDVAGMGLIPYASEPERWNLDAWIDDLRAFCEALGTERGDRRRRTTRHRTAASLGLDYE